MSKVKYKIPALGGDGAIHWGEIEGNLIDGTEGDLRFAVDYRGEDSVIGPWVATELNSGLMVCTGDSEEEVEVKIRTMMADSESRWAVEELIRRWTENG